MGEGNKNLVGSEVSLLVEGGGGGGGWGGGGGGGGGFFPDGDRGMNKFRLVQGPSSPSVGKTLCLLKYTWHFANSKQ